MQPLSLLLLPALALPALAVPASSAPLTSRAIPGLIGLVFVSEQETCADMIATPQYIDSLDASGLACYEIPEGQRGIHLLVDTPGCQETLVYTDEFYDIGNECNAIEALIGSTAPLPLNTCIPVPESPYRYIVFNCRDSVYGPPKPTLS